MSEFFVSLLPEAHAEFRPLVDSLALMAQFEIGCALHNAMSGRLDLVNVERLVDGHTIVIELRASTPTPARASTPCVIGLVGEMRGIWWIEIRAAYRQDHEGLERAGALKRSHDRR